MFATKRFLKQIIYGVLYLLFWAAVFYGVYLAFFQVVPTCFDNKQNQNEEGLDCGGVCAKLCSAGFEPIIVSAGWTFPIDGTTVLILLQNPNPRFGAPHLAYTFDLKGESGNLLGVYQGETFIYPGESEKRIFYNIPGILNAASAEVHLGEPEWQGIEKYSSPNIEFSGVQFLSENNKIFARGNIKNNETLLYPLIEVIAYFYDKTGELVSISHTNVRDVKAFEERFFQVEHPLLPQIDISKTQVFWDANRP